VDFNLYVLNSVIVSLGVTAIHVAIAGVAGFALAKFRFPGSNVLVTLLLATLMIPLEAIMIPLFLVIRDVGWVDTYAGMIAPMVVNAFGVILIRQYVRNIPDSMIEAARVEGASWMRILARIVVPVSWPAFGAVAVIMWRESWDAFLWPLLVVRSPDLYTLPLGLARFQQSFATNYAELMAISTLAMIPLIGVYLVAQRSFVRGIAALGPQG
jgi:ABC-type glycerol-3-phosphate transport system permease component